MPTSSPWSSTGRSRRASSSRSATTSTSTWSCPSGRRPRRVASRGRRRARRGEALLDSLRCSTSGATPRSTRRFGPGRSSIWGPNAAGKTSLLEAIVLLALGSLASDLDRRRDDPLGPAAGARRRPRAAGRRTRPSRSPWWPAGAGQRKRIRVNGVPRRASELLGVLRVVLFAPEEMLLVAGSPVAAPRSRSTCWPVSARRRTCATSRRTAARSSSATACCARSARSRPRATSSGSGTRRLLEAGGAIVAERLRLLEELAEPLPARARGDRAGRGGRSGLTLRYETNAPALPRRDAARRAGAAARARPPRRRSGTARTLVGPHRDDLVVRAGRSRSRGVRVAGPAADGDPRLQAGRARPADRARWPAAAAPARRRLQRARPGASRPPRASDRGTARRRS